MFFLFVFFLIFIEEHTNEHKTGNGCVFFMVLILEVS